MSIKCNESIVDYDGLKKTYRSDVDSPQWRRWKILNEDLHVLLYHIGIKIKINIKNDS